MPRAVAPTTRLRAASALPAAACHWIAHGRGSAFTPFNDRIVVLAFLPATAWITHTPHCLYRVYLIRYAVVAASLTRRAPLPACYTGLVTTFTRLVLRSVYTFLPGSLRFDSAVTIRPSIPDRSTVAAPCRYAAAHTPTTAPRLPRSLHTTFRLRLLRSRFCALLIIRCARSRTFAVTLPLHTDSPRSFYLVLPAGFSASGPRMR